MRSYVFTIIALCAVNFMMAQAGRYNPPTAYIQNTASGNINVPTNVLGSPYLNEDWKLGTVQVKGQDSYQAYMRYNAFHDEMEMQENDKAVALMKRDYITAELEGTLYKIIAYVAEGSSKKGYVAVLKEGPVSFYNKQQVILREGKEASSSYSKAKPPKFERQDIYLIAFGDEKAGEVKLNKKAILSVFPDKQNDLEKFVKENKLKLKSEDEIVKLMEYYETL